VTQVKDDLKMAQLAKQLIDRQTPQMSNNSMGRWLQIFFSC
jgi:hypothetical protein